MKNPRFEGELKKRIESNMGRAVMFVERQVKKKLTGPRSGRKYKRGGVVHQASAPGEPPADDTSTLMTSITGRVIKSPLSIRGVVGSNVHYARALELGRKDGHFTKRPYLRPTLMENRKKIREIISG